MRAFFTPWLAACLLLCPPAWAAHGYAQWGELKYPPGFAHFDYVNPQAPKGGELRLVSNLRTSTFDKYNPFTIRGSAPAYLSTLMFDSLLTGSLDESGSAYGLLAEEVQVAPDRLSATFRLRRQARFHNGDAVLAQDVKHSFDTLTGPHAQPGYSTLLADVAGVDVLDDRTVRFRFRQPNRELPLTVGSLPVFSRQWGQGKPFDQVVMDEPIGSGPYRIGPVKFGKEITYVRDPNYWARKLNVRVGSFNFDRILIKIYRDHTARLEAFKAGEFDLMQVFSAGDWARRVKGKRFDSGELVKGEFRHQLPTGFQSYVLNTRRPHLQDARVRQALGLAIDYEWMNRRMFYNAYSRVHGLFGNTECAASGPPDAAELALMQPLRAHIPPAAFGPAYTPPRTDRPQDPAVGGLRENLRRAQALLREAGYTRGAGGWLQNASGQPLTLEFLDSAETGVRVVTPWMRNLEKLGVRLHFRPVDFALYQQRLQKFDFDITSLAYQGTHTPGQEYADMFGSQAADTPDSGNMAGVKNPAVDALIAHMVGAQSHADFLAACRALERVVTHSHYLLPQWYSPAHRVAYNAWRLRLPATVPAYFQAEDWAMGLWWAAPQPGTPPAQATAAHHPPPQPMHHTPPAPTASDPTAQTPSRTPFTQLTHLASDGIAAAADGGSLMLTLTDAQGHHPATFTLWRRLQDRGSPRHNRLSGPQGELPPAQRQAFIAHLRQVHARLPAEQGQRASELLDFIERAERGPGAP